MYLVKIEVYDLTDRRHINAVFEQQEHGKTQRLVSTGLSTPLPSPVRMESHAEIVSYLHGIIPLLLEMIAARLDSQLPIE